MSYQLIRRDEYGGTDIIGTSSNVQDAVKLAKKMITEDNMDNALTFDDKMEDWESYFIEVLDEDGQPTLDAVYGGQEKGYHFVYDLRNNNVAKVPLKDVDVPKRFYIGTDNKKDLYAAKIIRGKPGEREIITDIKHEMLRDKTVYYLKVM